MLFLCFFICIFEVKLYIIPMPYGSIVLFPILIIYLFKNEESLKLYINILKSDYHISICLSFLTYLIFVLLNSIRCGDFVYFKTVLHQMISNEIMFALYTCFIVRGKRNKIFEYLIGAYVIMSIIQFFGFVSPTFRSATDIFRSKTVQMTRLSYDNFRGMGIASSGFFGLGVGYALILMLIFFEWYNWKIKNIFIRLFLLIILLFGAFTSARSAIFGAIIGALLFYVINYKYYTLCKNPLLLVRKQTFNIFILLISSILLIVLLYFITINSKNVALRGLNYYLFSFLFGFFNSEGMRSSTSGQALLDSMNVSLDLKQILIGDGRYTGINGIGNYMTQDCGYLRNIFFSGILSILLLCICQYFILRPMFKNKNRELILLGTGIFLLTAFLHIKGEVLGVCILYQNIVILYVLYKSYFFIN